MICKLLISFWLVDVNNRCLSVISNRFISSTSSNLEVLDLYYDFLFSNASSVEQRTLVVDKVKGRIQCCLLCLESKVFKSNSFSYSYKDRSCSLSVLDPKNGSVSFKKIPGKKFQHAFNSVIILFVFLC